VRFIVTAQLHRVNKREKTTHSISMRNFRNNLDLSVDTAAHQNNSHRQPVSFFSPNRDDRPSSARVSPSKSGSSKSSPCKPSPVALNNLQRRKAASLFPRSNDITSPSKKACKEEHKQVYTLKGNNNGGEHDMKYSRSSNGGANIEERLLTKEELAEIGLAREFVSHNVLRYKLILHNDLLVGELHDELIVYL
jgi:hypothetical protein